MMSPFTNPEEGQEPVPGYHLAQRLGRGGYGEVWRAYAPGGFQVALKFVPLADACGLVELKALEVIRDIRHPNLLVTFASWQIQDWLVIGMELADKTLMDRYMEAKNQGLEGIPRDELLDYFQEAARGIDFLNEARQDASGSTRAAIQHRDIKPQNILVVGTGVKVADFGLARLMSHAATAHSGGMTPAYAAPEFFKGQTTSTSDQYCLAVTYCKLRGGGLPFDGTLPEVMAGHLSQVPDLSMIPGPERAVVARALSKDPKERWPSCRGFVEAILAGDNVPQVKLPGPTAPLPCADFRTPLRTPLCTASHVPLPAMDASMSLPPLPLSSAPAFARAPIDAARQALEAPLAPGPSCEHKAGARSWVIGRDGDCNLVVNNAAVSGQHCRLTEATQGYVLEDLGSSNGTFVNGHRIDAAVHVLATDRVTLGHKVAMPWPDALQAGADSKVIHVGRDADNDVVLDYPTVSGRHARIIVRAGQAQIEDLGSTNGIAIGQPGSKVRQAPLHRDDTVFFGSTPVPARKLLSGGARAAAARSVVYCGQPIVFGRDPNCDLVLDYPTISGRHARLWHDGRRLLIEDLGSTNGTFVNGERIDKSDTVKRGDVIGLGSYILKLET